MNNNDQLHPLDKIEKLNDEHVIKTMFIEHRHILSILDELDAIANQISDENKDIDMNIKIKASSLVEKIISAEAHHAREENALFPAIESKGVLGPPHHMREEHDIIREMKYDLKRKLNNMDLKSEIQKNEICMKILDLCNTLRAHIRKENTILYPLALEIIDNSEWKEIKLRCDEIGYCSFETSCRDNNQEYEKSK